MSTNEFMDSKSNTTTAAAPRLLNSTATEFLAHEITSDVALTMVADIFKMVKMGVEDPSTVKMEVVNSEIRIRVENVTVLSAKKAQNGIDAWSVMADHQIRKVVNPNWTRFFFKQQ